MINGKMYKVLVPIERDGTKHWLRVGNAYTNKDASLNCYLDGFPFAAFTAGQLVLHLREYDEDELRRRDEYRARRTDSVPPARDDRQGVVPF